MLAMGIPYLILGKDAIFVYHDQLDGEVIAYLLQARHLWDGSGILPEFMNGASRTALTMPAPACVLLYRLLPAETALACMQVAGSFVGYVGMFLLLWWAAEDSEILSGRKGTVGFLAMTVGCMYAYLPFCRCTDCRNTDCRCSCIVYCGYGNGTDLFASGCCIMPM